MTASAPRLDPDWVASHGDPYLTLGLKPTATAADIKGRQRDLLKIVHPDKAGDDEARAASNTKTTQINIAVEALMSLGQRASIDLELREALAGQSSGPRLVPPPRPAPRPPRTTPGPRQTDPAPRPPRSTPGPRQAAPAPRAASAGPHTHAPDYAWSSILHKHHHRQNLGTVRGLLSFAARDRLGEWLAAVLSGLLLWAVSAPLTNQGALLVWLLCLGVQSLAARRLEHTPLGDLLSAGWLFLKGVGRVAIWAMRAGSRP